MLTSKMSPTMRELLRRRLMTRGLSERGATQLLSGRPMTSGADRFRAGGLSGLRPSAALQRGGSQTGHGLNTVGEDAQMMQLDLQSAMQRQQQQMQLLSNVMKLQHDTAMAVIGNIR